jgi:hypothetical protein
VTIGDIAYPNCFVPPPLALDLRRAACEASRIPKVPCRRRGTKARRRLSGETAAKLRSLNVAFSRGSRKSFSDRPPRTCSRSSPDFIFIVAPHLPPAERLCCAKFPFSFEVDRYDGQTGSAPPAPQSSDEQFALHAAILSHRCSRWRPPRTARPTPCSLGRRNVSRDLAAVGIPPQVQESLVRGSNEGALGCSALPTRPGFCAGVSHPADS